MAPAFAKDSSEDVHCWQCCGLYAQVQNIEAPKHMRRIELEGGKTVVSTLVGKSPQNGWAWASLFSQHPGSLPDLPSWHHSHHHTSQSTAMMAIQAGLANPQLALPSQLDWLICS